jgi:hypothetical protein
LMPVARRGINSTPNGLCLSAEQTGQYERIKKNPYYSVVHRELRRTFLFCVTVFAVNRLAFLRLKWNFTFLSAFCAGCFKHLARSKIFPLAPFAKISHVFSPN